LKFDESEAEDKDAYPIEVVLQHLTEEEAIPEQSKATNGEIQDGLFRSNMAADDTDELLSKAATNGRAGTRETVRAKYMIGCDGAHSWTRRQLGYSLEGEQTDYVWGVLDIIPVTDFPDIRMRCIARIQVR
jgi:phenol 2-monooxygenase